MFLQPPRSRDGSQGPFCISSCMSCKLEIIAQDTFLKPCLKLSRLTLGCGGALQGGAAGQGEGVGAAIAPQRKGLLGVTLPHDLGGRLCK